MTVDVIIPVYKPDQEFFTLLDRLESQTVKVNQIYIINTEEKYFSQLVYGRKFKEIYKNIRIKHISAQEFDHGGTRRRAAKEMMADVFVMMTQDAIPADERLIESAPSIGGGGCGGQLCQTACKRRCGRNREIYESV